jgi:hypothetical protein
VEPQLHITLALLMMHEKEIFNMKLSLLIKYFFTSIILLLFTGCDSQIEYLFVVKNNSNTKIYLKYIEKKYEYKASKRKTKILEKKYEANVNAEILVFKDFKINNRVTDYLNEWYENSGKWNIRFQLHVSKNKTKYYEVTGMKHWKFYKKNDHTGVYELQITNDIFNNK